MQGPNSKCGGEFTSWEPDTWGRENENSWSSESNCLGRKSGHDEYCGTDSQWKYVGGSPDTGNTPVSPPSAGTGNTPTIKIMSYNTEYKGYSDGRLKKFGNHINQIGATIVGLQEVQDINGGIMSVVDKSKYAMVPGTEWGPSIIYDKNISDVKGHGTLKIPNDEFDKYRKMNHAKLKIKTSGAEFAFLNTHLPHKHGDSSNGDTHKRIAKMFIDERNRKYGSDIPTIVTCDCNSHQFGSDFENNLPIPKVYVAKGDKGGYPNIDKIFASEDWIPSNAMDRGTGSSDHPAISVDLRLKDLGIEFSLY